MTDPFDVSGVRFLQASTVTKIRDMADDLFVIQAAKVSTLGEFAGEVERSSLGFIEFLMRNRHGSPFEHAVFTFLVKAPIFVWREIMRHRIASYNEESGRYKELAAEFYLCPVDRKLVQFGKAGAYQFEHGADDQRALVVNEMVRRSMEGYASYRRMLEAGIAREVARMVLPLNIFSSAYITINARSLMNFLSLRTKFDDATFPSFPMEEIEHVALDMENEFAKAMPLTHAAFVTHGRVAP